MGCSSKNPVSTKRRRRRRWHVTSQLFRFWRDHHRDWCTHASGEHRATCTESTAVGKECHQRNRNRTRHHSGRLEDLGNDSFFSYWNRAVLPGVPSGIRKSRTFAVNSTAALQLSSGRCSLVLPKRSRELKLQDCSCACSCVKLW